MGIARSFVYLLVAMALSGWPAQALAVGQTAARVESLLGSASALAPDQARRALAEGDLVYVGDRVETGDASRITLRFEDQSRFEIGPKGALVVDRFSRGDDKGTAGEFVTRIVSGAFRFATGLIARRDPKSMSVGLNVGTIGIRGTHVVGESGPTSATVILLEPEDEPRATAVEVYNQYGSVTIEEPGYGTEIPDQFSPPSPVRKMQVRQIQDLLRSLRSVQRLNIPRPR